MSHTIRRLFLGMIVIFAGIVIVLGLVQPAGAGATSPAARDQADKMAVAWGPRTQGSPFVPTVITPAAFGVTPPLADLKPQPSDSKSPKAVREIPLFRLPKDRYGRQPSGNQPGDGVLQDRPGALAMPSPIADFEGLGNLDNAYPPDTNGDIGYDPSTGRKYYFQWVNVHYQAWDVTNPAAPTVVVSPTLGNALWASALPASPCAATNDGDPIALFDEQAHRWMISQFSVANPFHQCLAVSQTADPAGSWYVYDYQYRDGVTWFNDYPHFGIWPDPTYNAYFMTVHQFNAAGNAYLGQGVAAFERAKLLAGDSSAQMLAFDLTGVNPNFYGMLPADLDGPPPPAGTPGYFFEVDDSIFIAPNDAMRIWEFRPNWANPASSTFGVSGSPNATLPVASFNLLPCVLTQTLCIPQPGTAQKLDGLGDRLMHRAAFRNFGTHFSVALNHTVRADGVGRAGVRWYEARNTGGAWSIQQQGTYAPADGLYRWMGSLAMDKDGDLALGYSVSDGSTTFPSIRYAGRLAADPLDTLPQAEITLIAGSGSQTGTQGRWGDYAMMGVDPQDGCTFWFTTEYIQTTGAVSWQTRIGSFAFPSCVPLDTGGLSGVVTNASNSNPIASAQVAAVNALGVSTYTAATNGSGQYQFVSLPTSVYTVTASAYGYVTGVASGVSVSSSQTTTQNFALTPLPTADLIITQTAMPDPVVAGNTLTYTLSVTNTGPDAITTTVTVVDNLPGSAIPGGVSAPGWSCGGSLTVTCATPGLAAGAASSIVITVTAPITAGTLLNMATITTTATMDPDATNNVATASTTVQAQADLSITQSDAPTVAPGGTLTYTLSVTNSGPSTVLVPVTTTFTNVGNITIADNAPASLYPSDITVAGLNAVQKATATLTNLTHTYAEDIDIIVVGPGGRKTFLMSDAGDSNPVSNVTLTFDDAAPAPLTSGPIASGIYKPTNLPGTFGNDVFPSPAPSGPYSTTLSAFNDINPNGTWSLYVRDDSLGDTGNIAGGWSLGLSTEAGSLIVTDTLPAGTTFVGASGAGWTCGQAAGVVTCAAPGFALGVAPDIVITVTAPLTLNAVLTNTAVVGSAVVDPNLLNNTSTVSTVITTPVYGVAFSPAVSVMLGKPGATITHTLMVTNTGNVMDTFTVTISGNSFPATAPPIIGPLGAGDSLVLNVGVQIPVGAAGGAPDVMDVTVTSQGDNNQSASATLTTSVGILVYLPLIQN